MGERIDKPLAVSMGEAAGIGPDLCLYSWLNSRTSPFYVVGSQTVLAERATKLGLSVPLTGIDAPEQALSVFPHSLPVFDLAFNDPVKPGQPTTMTAALAVKAIETAVDHVQNGFAKAIITAPIHKQSLYQAGFAFPGHTEYLAHLTGAAQSVMMLAAQNLRVVPVTVHVPLKDVANYLSKETIVSCSRITAKDLQSRFGIRRPRLAVAGLNPHAGEIGDEEATIIAPAIEILKSEGYVVTGPHPADTMFHEQARQNYDAAICMYHDQALIPLKTLDFWGGVNITLGLPVIRTSPDHGTALSLAGTGRINMESFCQALAQADKLAGQ